MSHRNVIQGILIYFGFLEGIQVIQVAHCNTLVIPLVLDTCRSDFTCSECPHTNSANSSTILNRSFHVRYDTEQRSATCGSVSAVCVSCVQVAQNLCRICAEFVQNLCRMLQVVDASDVLVFVLDARDPMGTRCLQLERGSAS